MTSKTKRRNHGRGHSYLLDGHKVSGVTTLISGGFPKTALINWAARTVAAKAVDEWDDLAKLPVSERLRALEKAHEVVRNSAGLRGTRVHELAHRLTHGEEVEVPAELAGHVDACVRFLDEWEVEPLFTERPVFSREHLYGGSPDLVARLRDGKTWLLDWKTNTNGPYGDMAFQLAAYRYAEFYLGEDGEECEMPAIDEAGVVWLRADGYDLFPFEAGPDVFRQFLYIAEVSRAAQDCRDYQGDPLIGVDA
ncbi:hypothetical protein [Actinomadura alba]|uniref:PD-(D/E)XK endonuclease-like domain-containing protein n=1 Tax=Actinomadura alba TaxID=406431 RepID=A0ABR7LI68_9ACTN|nr:hypothetical protein [Actinomadura alba]MBC6464294.1 hypothetical protein [Actinomadura alba]